MDEETIENSETTATKIAKLLRKKYAKKNWEKQDKWFKDKKAKYT